MSESEEGAGALDLRAVARRGAIRGLVLGAFLVAVVFAIKPFDPDWDFNWRKFAWWSTGSYYHDLALPQGAAVLYFLAGFYELPLAWVEERARRQPASFNRDLRAIALAVGLLVVSVAALSIQSLYIGHAFDGDVSFRRAVRYLGADFELLRESWGAIAARACALFAPFVRGMISRLKSLAPAQASFSGAVACTGAAVVTLVVCTMEFWDEEGRVSLHHSLEPPWEPVLSASITRPMSCERYLVLSVFLGALEPLLVQLADELDARLSLWLNSDDAA